MGFMNIWHMTGIWWIWSWEIVMNHECSSLLNASIFQKCQVLSTWQVYRRREGFTRAEANELKAPGVAAVGPLWVYPRWVLSMAWCMIYPYTRYISICWLCLWYFLFLFLFFWWDTDVADVAKNGHFWVVLSHVLTVLLFQVWEVLRSLNFGYIIYQYIYILYIYIYYHIS